MSRLRETHTLIVGSGVAGGLVAERLLAAGQGPVTMLEAGPAVAMRDRRIWLDHLTAGRLPYQSLGDQGGDYESTGRQAWRLQGGRLFARGGSTLHWGGWCPRMKPEDFELNRRIGHGGIDWPLTYAQLEPFYSRAEHYLQVAGDSRHNDPPRSADYPFEAPPFTLVDGEVIKAFERLGWSYGHIPIARNGAAINGYPPCQTNGTCWYCPIGGRFTGDQPLERLARRRDFTLITEAPVKRLSTSGKKRVVGVTYLRRGTEQHIDAARVILCTGALETPKLLLASKNTDWPEGIGNDHDHVGRHLVANPYFYARAAKGTNPRRLQEEAFFATLGSRHWDTPEHQREGKFFFNRGESPDLKPIDLMREGRAASELQRVAAGAHVIELQGTMQTFCHRENRVLPARGFKRNGLPRTKIESPVDVLSDAQKTKNLGRLRRVLETMGYRLLQGDGGSGVYPQRGDHAMCTCRMSEEPGDGVVDPDLRVHGTDNLFVVSNAVFSSGSPANPTLTLTALALRFTDKLTEA